MSTMTAVLDTTPKAEGILDEFLAALKEVQEEITDLDGASFGCFPFGSYNHILGSKETKQMTTQDKLLSALGSLDPNNPWSIIGPTFDKVEISEDVIAKARRQYPEHDMALWNAFKLLMPNGLLYEASEPVYRAHCAELLDRVRKGLDTTLGTKAEIMMALVKGSLETPLKHTASVLYAQLFREILPLNTVAEEVAQLSTMAHDDEVGQLLADLAQNTRVPEREPKKESEWRTPPV